MEARIFFVLSVANAGAPVGSLESFRGALPARLYWVQTNGQASKWQTMNQGAGLPRQSRYY
jgi:hypothetical protein